MGGRPAALSADMAERLKPAREPYHMAAQRLGVRAANVARPNIGPGPVGEIAELVAAHGRD